jgi:hypothetical protein
MATKMNDERGVSTTKGLGQFQYEVFISHILKGQQRVAWDYRDTFGVLHVGVAQTLPEAMRKASEESGETVTVGTIR